MLIRKFGARQNTANPDPDAYGRMRASSNELEFIRSQFEVIIDLADLTSEQYDEVVGIVRDISARLSLYESLPDCSSAAAAAASSDRNIFAAQLLRFAPLVDIETLLMEITAISNQATILRSRLALLKYTSSLSRAQQTEYDYLLKTIHSLIEDSRVASLNFPDDSLAIAAKMRVNVSVALISFDVLSEQLHNPEAVITDL